MSARPPGWRIYGIHGCKLPAALAYTLAGGRVARRIAVVVVYGFAFALVSAVGICGVYVVLYGAP